MGADGQVAAEEPAVQAVAAGKVQRRTIAMGVALGFVAAGVVGGLLVAAGGGSGGGSERIADTATTTTTVADGAPTTTGPASATTVDTTVATTVPAGGGGTPAAGPVPIDQQVADHEVRITDLEQAPPPTAAPAPATTAATVPVDPPRPARPPAPPCDGQLQWSDVQGWICFPPPDDPPVVP